MLFIPLIPLITLFSLVLANGEITSLPISATFSRVKRGATTISERDRARFQTLFGKHRKRTTSVQLTNTGLDYTVDVGFGLPPTYRKLAVDTGSSYTWIKKEKYPKTRTLVKQDLKTFNIQYMAGSATGGHYKDHVSLSPSLTVDMEFGLAESANKFEEEDGVLGLGPSVLSKGIISPNNGEIVPNIMDTLFEQRKIKQKTFGMSFAPTTSAGNVNGKLTVGGVDRQSYTGKLNWVVVTKQVPVNEYWGFEQTIDYGGGVIQRSSAGYVDAGTTLVYITPTAFKTYSELIPGSKFDGVAKLLEIPKDSIGKIKPMSFIIKGVKYDLTPSAQLWPQPLNELIGGKKNAYYSVIGALSDSQVRAGTNFIMGYAFLERFYTAYDVSNSRIGFAKTQFTDVEVDSGAGLGEGTSGSSA